MKTVDPKTEETKPAFAYEFTADGACTNPERVRVPMPTGAVCHLLCAQLSDGSWASGYAIGGTKLKLREAVVMNRGASSATREAALMLAAMTLEDSLADPTEKKYREAVQAWIDAAAQAGERWEPGPNQHGFKFDSEGDCVNPERIDVPMPRGVRCALFVAQMADGRWTYGCILCEAGLPAQKHPVRLREAKSGSCGDRAEAIETAAAIVRDMASENEAMLGALNVWAKGQLTATEPVSVPEVPAPSPAPETAPVPSVPDAVPLPGMAHEVNENGVFLNSEVVTVETPKKTRCALLLACNEAGLWAFGVDLVLPKAGRGVAPAATGATHPTREAALDAACKDARLWFAIAGGEAGVEKLAEKCIAAILAFWDDFRAKLAPEPAPAAAPLRPAFEYSTSFADLPVAKIQPNPENHRSYYDPLAESELAESIRLNGLAQPIAVRRLLEGEAPEGEFVLGDPSAPDHEVIFGHRRLRAHLRLKLPTVSAKIYHGLSRKQATALALIENLQREDINCMEKAEGYAKLMADENLTQEACADRVGKERSTVANAVRLLKLPEKVRESLRANLLTAAHGVALARFVPSAEPMARAEFPKWEQVVSIMAEEAVRAKTPAGAMEKGVPCITALQEAGMAVRVAGFGGEWQMPAKFKKHAAYFETRDGDFICFNPSHWQAEVAAQKKAKEDAETKAAADKAAELARLVAGGRKQITLADIDREQYREFQPVHESLLDLVPDDKKARAKDGSRKTTVVTDVELADRLAAAMDRAIKKNRKDARAELEERALKKIAALKKVGPRELAWLVYLVIDPRGREVHLHLSGDAVKMAEATAADIPTAARQADEFEMPPAERAAYVARRLALLAKADPVAVLRALMIERLPKALDEIEADGVESTGGRFVRWWLESDTLWLLEETEEGRAELIEEVKRAPWFQKGLEGAA